MHSHRADFHDGSQPSADAVGHEMDLWTRKVGSTVADAVWHFPLRSLLVLNWKQTTVYPALDTCSLLIDVTSMMNSDAFGQRDDPEGQTDGPSSHHVMNADVCGMER